MASASGGGPALAPPPVESSARRSLAADPTRKETRMRSGLDESQQFGVDLIRVRGGQAVRSAGVVDLFRTLDQPGRLLRRVLDGDDLVVFAVQHERRHVE